jgi:CheY-like chemotaxis protein
MRLLIVEDNEKLAALMAKLLAENLYSVDTVGTVDEARAAIEVSTTISSCSTSHYPTATAARSFARSDVLAKRRAFWSGRRGRTWCSGSRC